MARAIYTTTCAKCGAEIEIVAFRGTRREADDWKANMELSDDGTRLCEKCYYEKWKAEKEAESEKAKVDAREAGLPPLKGTDKQVNWAESIRIKLAPCMKKATEEIDEIMRNIDTEREAQIKRSMESGKSYEEADKAFAEAVEFMKKAQRLVAKLEKIESAKFWIDNRAYLIDSKMEKGSSKAIRCIMWFYPKFTDGVIAGEYDDKKTTEEEPEKTVVEEKPKEVVVKVTETETEISFFYKYDQEFIDIMHRYHARWESTNKSWRIDSKEKKTAKQIVEALTDKGINVEDTVDYTTPGKTESIKIEVGDDNHLGIWWNRYVYDLYDKAHALTGAKWKKPRMLVPVENYEEVIAFAEKYSAVVTDEAKAMIEKYKSDVTTTEEGIIPELIDSEED